MELEGDAEKVGEDALLGEKGVGIVGEVEGSHMVCIEYIK